MKFIWKKGFKCQMHRTNRYRRLFWFFEWNKKVAFIWPTQQYVYSWHNSHVFKVELYVYLSMLFSFWGAGRGGAGWKQWGGQKILDSNIIDKYIQIAKALQSKK